MQQTRLKYVGLRPYKSTDHVTGATVSVVAGAEVHLSPAKAAQVLKDFPASWQVLDAPVAPTPPIVSPPAPVVSPAPPVVPPEAPAAPPPPKAARKKPGRR